jgi:hypothetical protein
MRSTWFFCRYILQTFLIFYPFYSNEGDNPANEDEDDDVYAFDFFLLSFFFFFSYLGLCSIEITPPPTPSPVKMAGGKKRSMAFHESDNEDDVFVPR